MITLYISERIFLGSEKCLVSDENERTVFEVETRRDNLKTVITLYTVSGELICTVRGKNNSILPRYDIHFGESLYCSVSAGLSLFSTNIKIDSVNGKLSVRGNIKTMSYSLYHDTERRADIQKKWFDDGTMICVSPEADEDAAFIVALLFAIDECIKAADGK